MVQKGGDRGCEQEDVDVDEEKADGGTACKMMKVSTPTICLTTS